MKKLITLLIVLIVGCLIFIFTNKKENPPPTVITEIVTVTKIDTVEVEIIKTKFYPVKDTLVIFVDSSSLDSQLIRTLKYKDENLEIVQIWEVKEREDSLLTSDYKVKEKIINRVDSVFVNNTVIKREKHKGAVLGIGAGYNKALGWAGDVSMGYQFKTGWIFSIQGSFIENELFVGPKIQKTF